MSSQHSVSHSTKHTNNLFSQVNFNIQIDMHIDYPTYYIVYMDNALIANYLPKNICMASTYLGRNISGEKGSQTRPPFYSIS